VKGPSRILGIRPTTTAASVQVVATLPDGSSIPLLWLHDYKGAWKRMFLFRDPITLPKGAVINASPAYPFEFLVR